MAASALEIRIAADGTLYAMYSDALMPVFDEVGDIHVERASFVEFNDATQTWTVEGCVRSEADRFPRGFVTRAAALAYECEHFWQLIGREKGRVAG